jgi:hypothetical protein
MIWPDQKLVVVVELFKLVVGTHTDEYTAFCIFSRDGKLEMKEKGLDFCKCLQHGNRGEK